MHPVLTTTLAIVVAGTIAASPAWAATPATPLKRGPSFNINLSDGPSRGTDPIVYDSFTTAVGLTTTTGTPRSVMGGVVTLSGAGPQVDISAINVYAASTAAASYTNVRVNIQLWDTYTAAGVPVFSAPAGALITADLGPLVAALNTFSVVTVTLPAPVRLNSLTSKGVAVSYQVDTGSGLATTDNMTSLLTYNGAVSVGSNALNSGNGFFRNASNRSDYNFLSTDLRTFTGITDAGLGLILYGNASVPVTLQSFNVD